MSLPIEPEFRDSRRRAGAPAAEGAAEEREGSEEYFQAKQPPPTDLPLYEWEDWLLPPPQEMGEDG